MKTGEGLKAIQCIGVIENLCVNFNGRVCGVDASATAGIFCPGLDEVRCQFPEKNLRGRW